MYIVVLCLWVEEIDDRKEGKNKIETSIGQIYLKVQHRVQETEKDAKNHHRKGKKTLHEGNAQNTKKSRTMWFLSA